MRSRKRRRSSGATSSRGTSAWGALEAGTDAVAVRAEGGVAVAPAHPPAIEASAMSPRDDRVIASIPAPVDRVYARPSPALDSVRITRLENADRRSPPEH